MPGTASLPNVRSPKTFHASSPDSLRGSAKLLFSLWKRARGRDANDGHSFDRRESGTWDDEAIEALRKASTTSIVSRRLASCVVSAAASRVPELASKLVGLLVDLSSNGVEAASQKEAELVPGIVEDATKGLHAVCGLPCKEHISDPDASTCITQLLRLAQSRSASADKEGNGDKVEANGSMLCGPKHQQGTGRFSRCINCHPKVTLSVLLDAIHTPGSPCHSAALAVLEDLLSRQPATLESDQPDGAMTAPTDGESADAAASSPSRAAAQQGKTRLQLLFEEHRGLAAWLQQQLLLEDVIPAESKAAAIIQRLWAQVPSAHGRAEFVAGSLDMRPSALHLRPAVSSASHTHASRSLPAPGDGAGGWHAAASNGPAAAAADVSREAASPGKAPAASTSGGPYPTQSTPANRVDPYHNTIAQGGALLPLVKPSWAEAERNVTGACSILWYTCLPDRLPERVLHEECSRHARVIGVYMAPGGMMTEALVHFSSVQEAAAAYERMHSRPIFSHAQRVEVFFVPPARSWDCLHLWVAGVDSPVAEKGVLNILHQGGVPMPTRSIIVNGPLPGLLLELDDSQMVTRGVVAIRKWQADNLDNGNAAHSPEAAPSASAGAAASLVVFGLPEQLLEKELLRLLSQYGMVLDLKMKRGAESAVVEYEVPAAAARAKAGLQWRRLAPSLPPLRVEWWTGSPARGMRQWGSTRSSGLPSDSERPAGDRASHHLSAPAPTTLGPAGSAAGAGSSSLAERAAELAAAEARQPDGRDRTAADAPEAGSCVGAGKKRKRPSRWSAPMVPAHALPSPSLGAAASSATTIPAEHPSVRAAAALEHAHARQPSVLLATAGSADCTASSKPSAAAAVPPRRLDSVPVAATASISADSCAAQRQPWRNGGQEAAAAAAPSAAAAARRQPLPDAATSGHAARAAGGPAPAATSSPAAAQGAAVPRCAAVLWKGAIMKSGQLQCRVELRTGSDSSHLPEPNGWPDVLDVKHRMEIGHVINGIYKPKSRNHRALLWLGPEQPVDTNASGLRSFTAYLLQRARAGVIQLPSLPEHAPLVRILYLLPPSAPPCASLALTAPSPDSLLALVVLDTAAPHRAPPPH